MSTLVHAKKENSSYTRCAYAALFLFMFNLCVIATDAPEWSLIGALLLTAAVIISAALVFVVGWIIRKAVRGY